MSRNIIIMKKVYERVGEIIFSITIYRKGVDKHFIYSHFIDTEG